MQEESGRTASPLYTYHSRGPGSSSFCVCAYDALGGSMCSSAYTGVADPYNANVNVLQSTLINANVDQALNSGTPGELGMVRRCKKPDRHCHVVNKHTTTCACSHADTTELCREWSCCLGVTFVLLLADCQSLGSRPSHGES